jgi:hypothetical protein
VHADGELPSKICVDLDAKIDHIVRGWGLHIREQYLMMKDALLGNRRAGNAMFGL